jgi:hypothetical protein
MLNFDRFYIKIPQFDHFLTIFTSKSLKNPKNTQIHSNFDHFYIKNSSKTPKINQISTIFISKSLKNAKKTPLNLIKTAQNPLKSVTQNAVRHPRIVVHEFLERDDGIGRRGGVERAEKGFPDLVLKGRFGGEIVGSWG